MRGTFEQNATMSFLEEVEECFGNRELYAVLGVDRSAGQGELKKAYYRLSLKVHPDRARDEDETESTKKFQVGAGLSVIQSNSRVYWSLSPSPSY